MSLNTLQVTQSKNLPFLSHLFLMLLQSVWFESMNSLISGASLTSVQNHQYIGPCENFDVH